MSSNASPSPFAQYLRPNNYPPSKLVVRTLLSAVKPVEESQSNSVQPIRFLVFTLEPPTPRSRIQDKLCYAQQIIHSYRMQGIHRKITKQ